MTFYTLHLEPKPQSRPRFGRYGTYEDKKMKQWKRNCESQLRLMNPKIIEKGAIFVSMAFYIYPPKRITEVKKKRLELESEAIYVDKRPDIDNYIKAVLDCSNEILFKDDGQVAALSSQKLYSLNPRIEIEITSLEENK
ncbi:RusA family crossover junction endodeoxyribonuclease [Enterococcus raffinosus]|uniref:RusA family crossover junction endodeoxyribonuclease n=1 Tax=Enterococcus raffinosus TaxID=71452 RepID=UPI00289151A3|nr:RusA family crossover junction endodeoxyribonuclease [Enterococcus raffinosus]MDT2580220.1 RusA family crossover junction endodeoxyribonuclease [Enterococcus raffinosus]